jgi:hypothetical protein
MAACNQPVQALKKNPGMTGGYAQVQSHSGLLKIQVGQFQIDQQTIEEFLGTII